MQEWLGIGYGFLGGLLLVANITGLRALMEGLKLTSDLLPPLIAWGSYPAIVYLLICGLYYIRRGRVKANQQRQAATQHE